VSDVIARYLLACIYMRSIFASFFGFLALAFLGCDRHGTLVRFVLPEGFHGVFQISEDREHGVDLVKSNGMLFINVPSNGLVIVKDLSFLAVWHSETAVFPDGKLISKEVYDTNAVVLHGLFSEGRTNWVLVGTLRESRIAQSLAAKRMPLARPLTEDDVPNYGGQK